MTTVTSNQASDFEETARPELPGDEAVYLGLRLGAWVKIGTLALLFFALFWSNLHRLWDKTNPFTGEENWRHAMFVPLVGLYYLYVNREQLLSAQVKTTWAGLPIMLGGILFFGYAIWPGQNDLFKDVGMVIALFGVVSLLCGWEVMKTAWFPIVFLFCALPIPGLIYSMIAGPLQEFAARVAVHLMNIVGVQSGQSGTKIFVEGKDHFVHTLNVAEACSGLKLLMTFVAIAGAVAFLSFRPLWQKFIMVFSAIPIAIFCNTMRVTVQGVMARYLSMEWAEGAAHGLVGLVMMIPAFFLILLVGWVLQNIFIEEVDDKKALRESGAPVSRGPRTTTTARTISRSAVVARGGGLASENVVRTAAASRPAAQMAAAARVTTPKPAAAAPAKMAPAAAAAGAPPAATATRKPTTPVTAAASTAAAPANGATPVAPRKAAAAAPGAANAALPAAAANARPAPKPASAPASAAPAMSRPPAAKAPTNVAKPAPAAGVSPSAPASPQRPRPAQAAAPRPAARQNEEPTP